MLLRKYRCKRLCSQIEIFLMQVSIKYRWKWMNRLLSVLVGPVYNGPSIDFNRSVQNFVGPLSKCPPCQMSSPGTEWSLLDTWLSKWTTLLYIIYSRCNVVTTKLLDTMIPNFNSGLQLLFSAVLFCQLKIR